MTLRRKEITKVLRAVVKRARKANTASDVHPTQAELRAIREELMPAAIAHAKSRGRLLPAFAVLHGCRVFVWVNMVGQVGVAADRGAPPLAMSAPWRT